MVWSNISKRYQLISILESLQTWARFNSKNNLSRINELRNSLLFGSNITKQEIDDITENIVNIIIKSNDQNLLLEFSSFIRDAQENYSNIDDSIAETI
ncbi:MAG: hypothetical protein OEZ01_09160 [Candidatus Heimdallarchaeota archaeon]|nr:hypothetical protein [Candidatus Heimdallarchaeota archaeon]MDH5646163.1 hypothetical protein [Candidatus Heimdallarchaeota archaeon]